jgi:methionine synthase I (cobalamin-dependent)
MNNYPKSWDDVVYLFRKEVNQREDLPDFSTEQCKKISNLFWKQLRVLLNDTSSVIWIEGFINFTPRKKAIKRYQQKLEYLKNKYEKEKKAIQTD